MNAAVIGLVLLLTQAAAVPPATIWGRVLDPDGQATPDVGIVAWMHGTERLAGPPAVSGSDGTIEITGILPGKVLLRAVPRTDITASGVDLAPGSASEISIVLSQQLRQFPEPPPLNTGTSSIHGRVIDTLSGKPIEGAEVRLIDTTVEQEKKAIGGRTVTTRSFTRSGKTLTGRDGTYTFDGIRAGAYRLLVTHRMYLLSCMAPAALRGQCDVITVDADQRVADANMSLTPGGIIRGRVLDKDGQPLEGGLVKAEVDQALQGANSATTGADGRFEITSVPAGQLLIRVDPPGSGPAWHRTMYYPGVHSRDQAHPVTTEIGGTVEIELRLRDIPVATIRATLSGPEGFRVQKMTLINPDTRMLINMKVYDGVASVSDLDEGRYAIAVTAAAGSDTLAAYQLIIVGAGDYDVPMPLEPAATVTGRIVVDRGGVPPVDGLTVEAPWVNDNLKLDLTGPESTSVAPDGSFTMHGLFGRRQFQLFGLSDEWRVTAVRAGRADVTSGIDLAPGSSTDITVVVSRR
jgi:CBS domain-containing protein